MVFIEFLKILSVAGVDWLLLIEEVRMESHGFLAMATAFAPTTLYSRKKSDIPTNPDYIPSISVEEVRRNGLACARFERAQWRDKQKRDKEREAEQCAISHQQKLRAFHHDHNYGVKEIEEEVIICERPGGVSSLTVNEVGIPVEVGKCTLCLYVLCINCIL